MDDIATARFDCAQLDRATAPVRLRLNSTALRLREPNGGVDVSYVLDRKALSMRCSNCILACYNTIVPHLCPETLDAQKEGLKYGSKVTSIRANVLLCKAAPCRAAAATSFTCPNSYFHVVAKAPPVKLADYETPTDPDDPMGRVHDARCGSAEARRADGSGPHPLSPIRAVRDAF